MSSKFFRFDFRGVEGRRDNSYLAIKHEAPKAGEVLVGLSHKENAAKRQNALGALAKLTGAMGKKTTLYAWDFQDAILIETAGFDTDLGVFVSSNLEKQQVVPGGSTSKLKRQLKEKGHEWKENDISLIKQFAPELEEEMERRRREGEPEIKPEKRKITKRVIEFFRRKKNSRAR